MAGDRVSACPTVGICRSWSRPTFASVATRTPRRPHPLPHRRRCRRAGVARAFFTITSPSRFHRFTTVNGDKAVLPNRHCDGRETPLTGQRCLARLWTHIRSNLARCGLLVDGFRIAEPQHDGTPHWQLLLFTAADQLNAWATTWCIRQFQQIGGPPVNVWRELRQTSALPAGAPDHLKQACRAVNKHKLRRHPA